MFGKNAHVAIRWAGFLRFLRPRGGGVRGGGNTKMNGGTLMRQGPHKAVGYVCVLRKIWQECLVWVGMETPGDWFGPIPPTWEEWWEWKAEGWEEHGTSIVNHCLYFELGRLEEVASLASPSNSTCPLPQGKRNQVK